jgi:hypothetical protein
MVGAHIFDFAEPDVSAILWHIPSFLEPTVPIILFMSPAPLTPEKECYSVLNLHFFQNLVIHFCAKCLTPLSLSLSQPTRLPWKKLLGLKHLAWI